jgi:hypothetical protein
MALTAWQEQQQYSAQREMFIAQGARVGRSTHKVFTKGRGDLRIAQQVKFSLTFVEEPIFTSGVVLGPPRLVEHLYPTATVGVYHWERDHRGMYVGAYIWAVVGAGINQEHAGNEVLQLRYKDALDGRRSMNELNMTISQIRAELAQLRAGSFDYTLAKYQLAQAQAELAANSYVLQHHLVFEGLAIRDINYDQMMAD